jgi:hypothetical protein
LRGVQWASQIALAVMALVVVPLLLTTLLRAM